MMLPMWPLYAAIILLIASIAGLAWQLWAPHGWCDTCQVWCDDDCLCWCCRELW